MSYKLRFHALALEEWQRLNGSVREPFKNKLAERLENPRVQSAALSGMPDCYKIKLRNAGYRLSYRVDDDVVFVTVIAVGRRDKNRAYATVHTRAHAKTQTGSADRPHRGQGRSYTAVFIGVGFPAAGAGLPAITALVPGRPHRGRGRSNGR